MLVNVGGHVTWDASYMMRTEEKSISFPTTCKPRDSDSVSQSVSQSGPVREHLICSSREQHLRELCEGKTAFLNFPLSSNQTAAVL